MNLKIISAGAGSGKTYTLTNQMADLLQPDEKGRINVRPSGIIATTFTNKAAAELKERVRVKLLDRGMSKEADELGNALIGTVHAIGVQLLKRFAFEAGVSPDVEIIADTDHQAIFNQSLTAVLTPELIGQMNELSQRLGFYKSYMFRTDWRREMRNLVNVARSNNFDADTLRESRDYSLQSFKKLLPQVSDKSAAWFQEQLTDLLDSTLEALDANEDATKSKDTLSRSLKTIRNRVRNKQKLNWYEWVSISKIKPPKKCRDDVFDLQEFTKRHDTHPEFHKDIEDYITLIFDTAVAAIEEYQQYKKSRGLIDYTDMEVMILKLLENDIVLEVLSDEIDLLLVDEFQDTNPLQLKIFLQLSEIAKKAIWVGDPKQSIYGFRGAAPDLMEAVIDYASELENLPKSWRSRPDLVHLVNGLFVAAFDTMPSERVALEPALTKEDEPKDLGVAAKIWHFDFDGNRVPKSKWQMRCVARAVKEALESAPKVIVKGGGGATRIMQPKDVAILCRSNKNCQEMAAALYEEGLNASIARNGLLDTAEISLLHACMRYVLNKYDSLAVAEVLLLADNQPIEDLLANRLAYLNRTTAEEDKLRWGHEDKYVQILRAIRHQSKELSAAEILNWIIERLDVRRIVAAWSNSEQRLANIDALRKLALDYEDSCTRLHSAATLGGFLLWLDDLKAEDLDAQGSGEGPDAVRVMTYHKSKGLEWPMVVCHSLNASLKDSIWGIRIVRTADKIDIKNPLANRLICYWVNPYADQLGRTALEATVLETSDFAKAQKEALAEDARVLYVGLTRARDYLVFPLIRRKDPEWLNRTYHHGDSSKPCIDAQTGEILWTWEAKEIPAEALHYHFETNMATVDVVNQPISYLAPRSGQKIHDAANLDFSTLAIAENIEPTTMRYAKAIQADFEVVNYEMLQGVVRSFILADSKVKSEEERLRLADQVLIKNDLTDLLSSSDLLSHSKAFYTFVKQQFGVSEFLTNQRVKGQQNGTIFQGQVNFMALNSAKKMQLLLQVPRTQMEQVTKKTLTKAKEEIALLSVVQQQQEEVTIGLWCPIEGTIIPLKVKKDKKNAQTKLF